MAGHEVAGLRNLEGCDSTRGERHSLILGTCTAVQSSRGACRGRDFLAVAVGILVHRHGRRSRTGESLSLRPGPGTLGLLCGDRSGSPGRALHHPRKSLHRLARLFWLLHLDQSPSKRCVVLGSHVLRPPRPRSERQCAQLDRHELESQTPGDCQSMMAIEGRELGVEPQVQGNLDPVGCDVDFQPVQVPRGVGNLWWRSDVFAVDGLVPRDERGGEHDDVGHGRGYVSGHEPVMTTCHLSPWRSLSRYGTLWS